MTKTLTKTGNSFALIIERPILEMMGIDEGTPLHLELHGQTLTVRRAGQIRDAKFEQAKTKSIKRYDRTYKRLSER